MAMANGLFGSSKSTLIFAGGVVACAAIVATSMGSQFVPKPEDINAQEREAAAAQKAQSKKKKIASNAGQSAFGNFADDSELMDDASGFDTEPDFSDLGYSDNSIAESSSSSSDSNDGGFARAPGPRTSRGTRSADNSVFESNTMKTPRSQLIPPNKATNWKKAN
ncbi:MAG: hypothetical protein AAFR64_00805 [Pseudomonadota bacterium]